MFDRGARAGAKVRRLKREPAEALPRATLIQRDLNACLRDTQQLIATISALKARRYADRPAREYARAIRISMCAIGAVFGEKDVWSSQDRVDLAPALGRVVHEVALLHGRRGVGLRMTAARTPVPLAYAQCLTLAAAELATNAFQHAFRRRRFGTVELGLEPVAKDRARLWVSDNGIGLSGPMRPADQYSGLRFAEVLARQVGGSLICHRGAGTRFEIDFAR